MQNSYTGELAAEDYVQSSNSLFHFMPDFSNLIEILEKRAIIPRYCCEDISYLDLDNDNISLSEIYILEKCFCDIPLHKITEKIYLYGIGDEFENMSALDKYKFTFTNTHTNIYGEYGIALSKKWGEINNLQPVHYLSSESEYTKKFSELLKEDLSEEELSDSRVDDILRRLSLIKPLRGKMIHNYTDSNGKKIKVKFQKNFHDEQEWRFLPNEDSLNHVHLDLIARPRILEIVGPEKLNENIKNEKYRPMWLSVSYDEIRYIIVSDNNKRDELLNVIMSLPNENFNQNIDIELQKIRLCSRILVIDEIRKDW